MIRIRWRYRPCIIALVACAGSACAQEKISAPRADGARVPLLVYEPAHENNGCPPLALLSPGAGGDERGLRYLGEALSAGAGARSRSDIAKAARLR